MFTAVALEGHRTDRMATDIPLGERMKLLLFSDLHCNREAARRVIERSSDVDVVVGAGDFGNVRRGLDQSIGWLKAIECPAVLVCGNAESEVELLEACRIWPSARVLHGSSVDIEGVTFFGLGGAVPVTPFGSWSYDLTEEQAENLLADCPDGCVLVSHSPPKGTLDVGCDGKSLGSTAVRDVIERKKPVLVVCGHIHACAGQRSLIGETVVINAGPDGVVLELPTD